MINLSPAELDANWSEVEAVVDQTSGIDRWCSGPDWVLPVHLGFGAGATPFIMRTETSGRVGYALLARYVHPDGGLVLAGLEPLWGFASPLLGSDIAAVTGGLAQSLLTDDDWTSLVIPGLPIPTGSDSFTARVAQGLSSLGPVSVADGIVRQVADLDDGYEHWFDRRSSRFRRNLRRAERQAEESGLTMVDVSSEPQVFERLLAIEMTSWKGLDDSGITSPEMTTTYRTMIDRLGTRDRLRAYVAQLHGADVGYIVGGVRNARYRGLQISFRADLTELSIGHLLQWHQLKALCLTNDASTYDLGMDLTYKRRWADRSEASLTLIVERS